MKICHVVTNDMLNDPRVDKIATALSSKYEVVVLGLGGHRSTDFSDKNYSVVIAKRNNYRVSEAGKQKIRKSLVGKKSIIRQLVRDFVNYSLRKNNSRVMYKELRNIDADIYVANDLDTLPFVAKVAKAKNAKLIYDSHEYYTDSGVVTTTPFKTLFKLEELRYIKKADAVMTVNTTIAELLQKEYKLQKTPYTIYNIPNYKTNAKYPHTNNNIIKVVFSGILSPGRGLDEYILSAKHLPENITLNLQGYGPREEELKTIVRENNLENKVFFIEAVPMNEITASLNRYDIGIVPYQPIHTCNKLCSPNKLFEYIHANLAVVGSDLPELRRFITLYELGDIFDPYNPEDMARAIIATAKSLDQFKANSKKASGVLTWKHEEKKLFEVYDYVEKQI